MSVERKYIKKLKPKCLYLAHVLAAVYDDLPFRRIHPHINLGEDLRCAMLIVGLGKTLGLKGSYYHVKPPSGQTSVGSTLSLDGLVLTGSKPDVWLQCMAAVSGVLEFVKEHSDWLNWESVDSYAAEICYMVGAAYSPTVRVDRGWDKIRILYMGSSALYILETWVAEGIKEDMRNSISFGYKPWYAEKWQDAWSGRSVISGDAKAFDQSLTGDDIKCCWRTWQEMYNLPEPLMCLLYAVNRYAPMWDPFADAFRGRDGMNPSGAGCFVIINNLALLLKKVQALRRVGVFQPTAFDIGIGFGDDHCMPMPSGVDLGQWVTAMAEVGLDVGGSVVANSEFLFLRMLFNKQHVRDPIVFSRFRSAACPETFDVRGRHEALVALALRAQLLPFVWISRDGYLTGLTNYLIDQVFSPGKVDSMLVRADWTDAQLSRELSARGIPEPDTLGFVKSAYQIKDSLSFFKR